MPSSFRLGTGSGASSSFARAYCCWLAVILFAIMLIGVPISLWPARSLSFAIKSESENIVLMCLVAASVRSIRDIEWLAKINLYGALFFSLIVSLFFKVGQDGRLEQSSVL